MPTEFEKQAMGIGLGAAGDAVGGIMGLALAGINDRRQIRQQQKLTDMQLLANKSMSQFNMAQQYDFWQKTNYPAQLEMMKKAGLNPGLMYGMGGAGGATTGSPSGGISGGLAPSGGGEIMGMMQQRMQLEMLRAQKANIEADTANKQAENPNIAKAGTKLDAEIAQLIQSAKTGAAQEQLAQAMTTGKNIENEIANATKENAISAIQANMQQQWQLFDKLVRENQIGNQTYQDLIRTIKEQAIGAYLNNQEIRQRITESGSRITLNEATIKKMAADIIQRDKERDLGWANWEETHRNANTNETNAAIQKQANEWHQTIGLPLNIAQDILNLLVLKGILNPAAPPTSPVGFDATKGRR